MQQVCPYAVNTITLTLALTLLHPRTHPHPRPYPPPPTYTRVPAGCSCLQKIDFGVASTTQSAASPDWAPGNMFTQDICQDTAPGGGQSTPLDEYRHPLGVSYLTKDVSKDEDADNHAEKSGEAFSENDLGLGVDVWCA